MPEQGRIRTACSAGALQADELCCRAGVLWHGLQRRIGERDANDARWSAKLRAPVSRIQRFELWSKGRFQAPKETAVAKTLGAAGLAGAEPKAHQAAREGTATTLDESSAAAGTSAAYVRIAISSLIKMDLSQVGNDKTGK